MAANVAFGRLAACNLHTVRTGKYPEINKPQKSQLLIDYQIIKRRETQQKRTLPNKKGRVKTPPFLLVVYTAHGGAKSCVSTETYYLVTTKRCVISESAVLSVTK
jgi:hypothetical protein